MQQMLCRLACLIAVCLADAGAQAGNLVEVAQEAGKFNTLIAAAKAAGVAGVLQGDTPLTVFAPTDEAFAELPAGTVESLLKPENKDKLAAILKYHVVAGRVPSSAALRLSSADTLNGQRLDVTRLTSSNPDIVAGKLFIDQSEVITADVAASNGVIHVINKVLLPESNDLVDAAASAGTFKTLLAAAGVADLVGALRGDGPLTVLAPTDDAFAKLPAGTVDSLLKPENREELKAVLTNHVIPGRVYADQALEGATASTIGGGDVRFCRRRGGAFVNQAKLVQTDIDAANGVIHVIDSVLLPGETSAPEAMASLTSAIDRGAPMFNSGNHHGCMVVYRDACQQIVDDANGNFPAEAAFALQKGLDTAARTHSVTRQAWALREAMDRSMVILQAQMRVATKP